MRATAETRLGDAIDALDHIKRVCDGSRTQTRRIQWIKLRAESGITGDSAWQSVDLPSADNKNLVIKNAKLRTEKAELDELLADVMAEYQVAASVTQNTEYAKRYIELAQRYEVLMAKAKS